MTVPSQLAIAYPSTFATSFWSFPDYRTGAVTLYARLQEGLYENESVLALLAQRAEHERSYAHSLARPLGLVEYSEPLFEGAGNAYDGARGLFAGALPSTRAFRSLENEFTHAYAAPHLDVARNMQRSILTPFGEWVAVHDARVRRSWEAVNEVLVRLERQAVEVGRLQGVYEHKCRLADEAEDDVRFAPGAGNALRRTSSIADLGRRISQVTGVDKGVGLAGHAAAGPTARAPTAVDGPDTRAQPESAAGAADAAAPSAPEAAPTADTTQDAPAPETSAPLPKCPAEDAQKLQRRETLRQQFGFKARSPSAPGRQASRQASGQASKQASTQPADPAPTGDKAPNTTDAAPPHDTSDESATALGGENATGTSGELAESAARPRLSSYFTQAAARVGDSQTLAHMRAAVSGLSDPRHIRLRRDAETAEQRYQAAVRALDEARCRAEEVLFHEYQMTQRWEEERVLALRRVLDTYNACLTPLVDLARSSLLRTGELAVQLEAPRQLRQIMDEARTGPFRPAPTVFHPYYHDDINAVAGASTAGFGMDLVAAAKREALAVQEAAPGSGAGAHAMPALPPVLHALLSALQRKYAEPEVWRPRGATETPPPAAMNAEKRRVWLYEVPLRVTHGLRAQLIEHAASQEQQRAPASSPSVAIPDAVLDAADAPVLAATVKLWALELESPLLPYTVWDEVAQIYDAAELYAEERARLPEAQRPAEEPQESILRGLATVLSRLPKLHLACIDALACHLYKLVRDTPTDEDDDSYTSKLGLSLGRSILRPHTERPSTLHAKYPALLVKDLVRHYEALLPQLVNARARESDHKALGSLRSTPLRRRSKPTDERISRSSLRNVQSEGMQRRVAQFEHLQRSRSVSVTSPPQRRFDSPRKGLVLAGGAAAAGPGSAGPSSASPQSKTAPSVDGDPDASVIDKFGDALQLDQLPTPTKPAGARDARGEALEAPREAPGAALSDVPRGTPKEPLREAPSQAPRAASSEAPREALKEPLREAPREAPRDVSSAPKGTSTPATPISPPAPGSASSSTSPDTHRTASLAALEARPRTSSRGVRGPRGPRPSGGAA